MASTSTARVSKRAFGFAIAVAAVAFASMAFSIWHVSTVAPPWAVAAGFAIALVYALALAIFRLRRPQADHSPAPRLARASGRPRLRRVK
jgi:hypothetical protein